MSLLLGSASPRRAALLAQLGVDFCVLAADIDETVLPRESPAAYVQRVARAKAEALRHTAHGAVLTADTTVCIDGEILGKPGDAGSARAMLRLLSDREHEVMTAVCLTLKAGAVAARLVRTSVRFCALDAALIDAYLATDEPWDKAGSYAIQGLGGSFVRCINGSYSNVVGLPLVETRELLLEAGIRTSLAAT